MKSALKNQLFFAIAASLTLGLAPFNEPHVLGKIKWLRGGAIGMKSMDWFDLLMHGAPWIYLLVILSLIVIKQFKKSNI